MKAADVEGWLTAMGRLAGATGATDTAAVASEDRSERAMSARAKSKEG